MWIPRTGFRLDNVDRLSNRLIGSVSLIDRFGRLLYGSDF